MDDRLLAAIATAVGTPVFVYDAGQIRARYAALTDALRRRFPHDVHYSVKANSNLAVLRLIRSLGAGADIVSGGELRRVQATGFPGGAVVFSGVGKTDAELDDAQYTTLGGYLFGQLGRLPKAGDRVPITGKTFEIVAMDGRRVKSVRLV